MRKLGSGIVETIKEMGGDSDRSRIMARAAEVRNRYRAAIEKVYRSKADLFLKHTNSVYILDKSGKKTLIVYVDESIFAAELNAQRELIKLVLLEMFREDIEEFEIHISRGSYRSQHPFVDEEVKPGATVPVNLDEEDEALIQETVENVTDPRLKAAIKRAMTADLKRSKSEYGKLA